MTDRSASELMHEAMPLCATLGARADKYTPAQVAFSLDWRLGYARPAASCTAAWSWPSVTATAAPLHVGVTTIVVETSVRDSSGRLVTKVTQTQMVPRPRR